MSERSVAQLAGERHYFTGHPCSRGHVAKRRTVNGSCTECERENDCKRVRPNGYGKKKYWANQERHKQYKKDSYARHREKRIEETLQWQKENPGKVNAKNAKRRAALVKATPPWLTPEHYLEMRTIYVEAAAKGMEVDHEVPIRGKNVCGLHVPWNLQLLSSSENCSKGNRHG